MWEGHVWQLQKSLDDKKGSLRKTYKSQTEANEKVWSLNMESEKALEGKASTYERSKQSNEDLCEVDKKFDAEFEEVEDPMVRSRSSPNWQTLP